MMKKIKICDDFSDAPGGRYINEGEFSGEEFREQLLLPNLIKAEKDNEKLEIDFDGCYGFSTSFLEEAFGGLVRCCRRKGILKIINIVSTEDEGLKDLVEKYILSAENALEQ